MAMVRYRLMEQKFLMLEGGSAWHTGGVQELRRYVQIVGRLRRGGISQQAGRNGDDIRVHGVDCGCGGVR